MPIKVITEGDTQKEICVLSYSSYSTYKQCSHRYYLEKIAKVPIEHQDLTYTVPGSILHDSAAHFFKTGSLELFEEEYLRSELQKRGESPTVNYDKAYGSFDKAMALIMKSGENLKLFLVTRERDKRYMSEQWFGVWNAPLYLSDNLAIQGAADLIELNENNTALLYDFKTSWKTTNLSRDQLILYSIAVKRKWGIDVTMSSFFLLPANKHNYFTFNEGDKVELLNRLQQAADTILEQKEKLPICKNDKCKWCPYYDSCDANKVEKQVENLTEGSVSFDFGANL